jgi:hypothetical protein
MPRRATWRIRDGAMQDPEHGLRRIPLPLDFSHLSQIGWVAHCPSSQREVISSWLHTPLFPMAATKLQAALQKGLLRGF